MKKKYRYTIIISMMLLLNGCGGKGDSSQEIIHSEVSTFTLEEKKFLHTLFLTEYLWYDQVSASVDYNQYQYPQEMIDDLRIDPPDKWSFMISQKSYESLANQQTSGFGFRYRSDFKVYLVRIDAPAWGKLQRGDQIIAVDGESPSIQKIDEVSKNLNVPAIFTVQRDAKTIDVALTPRAYNYKVTQEEILHRQSKKIGYLRFDAFTENSVTEIEHAFDHFHTTGIDELVIDLRYNGGGSIDTASILLDNITNKYPGQRQMYLDWNANNQNKNSNYYFEEKELQDGNELTMSRVVFLVTKGSASASETLINALIPYLGRNNIITIGDTTHGKPVGMSGKKYGKHYYFLINFTVNNTAGDNSGFDGIPATCSAKDDLSHQRGDSNESMLKTALHYLETGLCL